MRNSLMAPQSTGPIRICELSKAAIEFSGAVTNSTRDAYVPKSNLRKQNRQRHLGSEHAARVVTAERDYNDLVFRVVLSVDVRAEGLPACKSGRSLRHCRT